MPRNIEDLFHFCKNWILHMKMNLSTTKFGHRVHETLLKSSCFLQKQIYIYSQDETEGMEKYGIL